MNSPSESLPKIEVICFDLGKVLIDFDWQIGLRRMAEKCPYSTEEISARMRADSEMLAYEVGEIESGPFFEHLKGVLDFTGTPQELRHYFSDMFSPIDKHIALLRAVSQHYPVGLISNTNDAHIQQALDTFDFFPCFKALIYSHTVHYMKPEPEIYEIALKELAPFAGGSIDPKTALFIDDLAPNIQGAVDLGWQTIHLLPTTDLKAELLARKIVGV